MKIADKAIRVLLILALVVLVVSLATDYISKYIHHI